MDPDYTTWPQEDLVQEIRNLQEMLERFLAYAYITDRYGETGHADDYLTQEDWDQVSDWGTVNDPGEEE